MNLILLYYVALCGGLSPFKYDQSIPKTFESSVFASVNLIIGCFFSCCAVLSQLYISFTWIPDRPKTVLLIVSYVEGILLCTRNITIFFIQFSNRKKLVKFINEGFDLASELKTLCPRKCGSSVKLRRHLICKCFQIILSIIALLSFLLHDCKKLSQWLCAVTSIFVYLYPFIITSFYYCGSVMISARFYEILNSKILSLLKNADKKSISIQCSREQVFCNISNDIDYVSVLYNRIANFVESINKYLSLQVVVTKLASFVMVLSNVNLSKFKITRQFLIQIPSRSF